jgi:hypothetical protein
MESTRLKVMRRLICLKNASMGLGRTDILLDHRDSLPKSSENISEEQASQPRKSSSMICVAE